MNCFFFSYLTRRHKDMLICTSGIGLFCQQLELCVRTSKFCQQLCFGQGRFCPGLGFIQLYALGEVFILVKAMLQESLGFGGGQFITKHCDPQLFYQSKDWCYSRMHRRIQPSRFTESPSLRIPPLPFSATTCVHRPSLKVLKRPFSPLRFERCDGLFKTNFKKYIAIIYQRKRYRLKNVVLCRI